MSFKTKLTLAAALGLLAITPAYAQEKQDGPGRPGGPGGPGKHFENVDKDGDGFVTKDEMLAAHRERIDKMFTKLDTDKDGKLSKEELKKGHEEMRGKMRERIKDRIENKTDN